MVKIKPVVANNLNQLEEYIDNSNKVILIVNKELIPKIKRRVKEDQYNRKSINILKGLAVAGGAFLIPVVGPVTLIASGAALISGIFMSANQIWKRINVQLQDYTWSETTIDNGVNVLVLTKTFGENRLYSEDEVDFESIKEYV